MREVFWLAMRNAWTIFGGVCAIGFVLMYSENSNSQGIVPLYVYERENGLLYEEDFSSIANFTGYWETMNHPSYQEWAGHKYGPTFTAADGSRWIHAVAGPNEGGSGHAGMMTLPHHYNQLSGDMVLQAHYRIANYPEECIHYSEAAYYQLHLCTAENGDHNVSATLNPQCGYQPKIPTQYIREGVSIAVELSDHGTWYDTYWQANDGTWGELQSGPTFMPDSPRRIEMKALHPALGYDPMLDIREVKLYRQGGVDFVSTEALDGHTLVVEFADERPSEQAAFVGSTAQWLPPVGEMYPMRVRVGILDAFPATTDTPVSDWFDIYPASTFVVSEEPIPGC